MLIQLPALVRVLIRRNSGEGSLLGQRYFKLELITTDTVTFTNLTAETLPVSRLLPGRGQFTVIVVVRIVGHRALLLAAEALPSAFELLVGEVAPSVRETEFF